MYWKPVIFPYMRLSYTYMLSILKLRLNFTVGGGAGKMIEYDQPTKLLENSSSLFARLVAEYWANTHY